MKVGPARTPARVALPRSAITLCRLHRRGSAQESAKSSLRHSSDDRNQTRQTIGIINILVATSRPCCRGADLGRCVATRTLNRLGKDSVFRMYDPQIVETCKPYECWIPDAKAFRLGLI